MKLTNELNIIKSISSHTYWSFESKYKYIVLIFEKAPFLPKNIVESKNEKKQDRDAVKKLKNCRVHSSSKQSQITA